MKRVLTTIAGISLAANACDEMAPPDDAQLATLSGGELIALCDELRDTVADHPIQCEEGDRYWLLPSNQSCRDADLTNCPASAGDVRAWHEQARSDPCAQPEPEPGLAVEVAPLGIDPNSVQPDVLTACAPFLPKFQGAVPSCPPADPSLFASADGVYELVSSFVPAQVPCHGTLPAVLESNSPRLLLVATQASGVPEVILKSCGAVADCQALARELRAFGDAESDPRNVTPGHHFDACRLGPGSGADFLLHARVPEGVPFCEAPWLPTTQIYRVGADLTISVSTGWRMRASSGCGYVIAPSLEELAACSLTVQYDARFVSPL